MHVETKKRSAWGEHQSISFLSMDIPFVYYFFLLKNHLTMNGEKIMNSGIRASIVFKINAPYLQILTKIIISVT